MLFTSADTFHRLTTVVSWGTTSLAAGTSAMVSHGKFSRRLLPAASSRSCSCLLCHWHSTTSPTSWQALLQLQNQHMVAQQAGNACDICGLLGSLFSCRSSPLLAAPSAALVMRAACRQCCMQDLCRSLCGHMMCELLGHALVTGPTAPLVATWSTAGSATHNAGTGPNWDDLQPLPAHPLLFLHTCMGAHTSATRGTLWVWSTCHVRVHADQHTRLC